jgi:hypothetical protein
MLKRGPPTLVSFPQERVAYRSHWHRATAKNRSAHQGTDRAVGLGVLADEQDPDKRAQGFLAPAASAWAEATETRLVLKHQTDRPGRGKAQVDMRQVAGAFFFQASRAKGSPLG